MRQKLILGMVAALLMGLNSWNVSAAETGPADFMKTKDGKLKPLLTNAKKNKKKILTVINEMMDFEALSEASLGSHWAERSADEQKKFSTTLRSLIEENLVNRLKDSKDHDITYGDETVNADKTEGTVTTTLKTGKTRRAEEIEVVYKMKKKGAKWIVTDMITDGVSMVGNYQSQFNKIIKDEGFDALMKRMNDKLAEERGEKKPAEPAPAEK